VRRLPHQLVEGFAATLEETLVADLVLHVVDGSASEQQLVEQIAAVDSVLREIGATELPVELVVNKIDAVDTLGRRRLANRSPDALQISALTGEGLDELRARIAERFGERFERVRLLVPYDEGGRLNELYALGAPIDEREDTAEGVLVVARLPRRELHRYAPYLIAEEAPKRRRKGACPSFPCSASTTARHCRRGPTRATRVSTWPPPSASSSARGSAPRSGPAFRWRSPRVTPASCSRARGSPPS